MIPFIILGVLGAGAFYLFERGHASDPVGITVWEALKLHWKALLHAHEATKQSDPTLAASHGGAATGSQELSNAKLGDAQRAVTSPKQQEIVAVSSEYMIANAAWVKANVDNAVKPSSENAAVLQTAKIVRDAAAAKLSKLLGRTIP